MTKITKKSDNNFPVFSGFKSLFGDFDSFMTEWQLPFKNLELGLKWDDPVPNPKMELKVNEDNIEVVAEIPGMDKEAVDVRVDNNVLTISGEKKQITEKKDENGKIYASERSYGSFSRSVSLGDNIDKDAEIDAELKDGVLTVKVPTTKQLPKEQKKIEIK